MTLPRAQPGLVIRYAYLWRDRRDAGHEHGDKDRPCAVVLVRATAGDAVAVTVAPITHRTPDIGDNAVQLSRSVKQAIGLDDAPAWVVTTEVNRFLWPGPDLRPVPGTRPPRFHYGFLPSGLFNRIKRQILENAQRQRRRGVTRTS